MAADITVNLFLLIIVCCPIPHPTPTFALIFVHDIIGGVVQGVVGGAVVSVT